MVLSYWRNSKYLFLFVCVLTSFSMQQLIAAAAGAAAEGDPGVIVGAPYPLGGTWRKGFGDAHDLVHAKLCKREMSCFYKAAAGAPGFYLDDNTNVATFELRGTKIDNTQVILLECTDPEFCFFSGKACGSISIDGVKVRFTTLDPGTRTALANSMKKPEAKDTIAEEVAAFKRLADDAATLESIYTCLEEYVENYPISGFKEVMRSKQLVKEGNPVFAGAIKHITDSEQSIMRCLDVFFARGVEHFSGYKSFDLHVHTRFDMCRFCLRCMHERVKSPVYWRRNLEDKSLKVFVSSRQDYRELERLPNPYKSMRFIGCDDRSKEVFDEEADKDLLTQEIIFQTALPPALQVTIARSFENVI